MNHISLLLSDRRPPFPTPPFLLWEHAHLWGLYFGNLVLILNIHIRSSTPILWFPLLCHCKKVCEISYPLCLCPTILFPVMSFNWKSRDSSAPVLNNVRTLHVPKISSFSLQLGHHLFVKRGQGISEVSWTQILFWGGVVPFLSGSLPLTCPAWVTLPVAMLLPV